jgi:hypothetical protein
VYFKRVRALISSVAARGVPAIKNATLQHQGGDLDQRWTTRLVGFLHLRCEGRPDLLKPVAALALSTLL